MKQILLICILTVSGLFLMGCSDDEPDESRTPVTGGTDNVKMVPIPAGEFQMGDSLDGMSLALPVHRVYLDAFFIDAYEVTNAQYRKFMDATNHQAPREWNNPNFNAANHPVVGVTWHDAIAYATWVGKRLPTETEWEKAARGGIIGRRYPWGNELKQNDANYNGVGEKDQWSYTSPVGSFTPNDYGLYDMVGNACEWCMDWYDSNYYSISPNLDPAGPNAGTYRVLRGGSWHSSSESYLCVAYRHYSHPGGTSDCFGFRCVRSK